MQHIEIFLNELSWEHAEPDKLDNCFKELYKTLKAISQQQKNVKSFAQIGKLEEFVGIVEDLLEDDKMLKTTFRKLVFESIHFQDWAQSQSHKGSINYYYLPGLIAHDKSLLNGTSIAEIAERQFLYGGKEGKVYLLVNVIQSVHGNEPKIQVVRDQSGELKATIDVDYIETDSGFHEWISPYKATHDFFEDKRFEPTSTIVQGKRVYKECSTGYYWYFDNFHRDYSETERKVLIELEVFDANGNHLGTSNPHDGTIDKSKRKKNRTINIK